MSRNLSIVAALVIALGGSALNTTPAAALVPAQISRDIAAPSGVEEVRHRHRHRPYFFYDGFDRRHRWDRHRRSGVVFQFYFGPTPAPRYIYRTYDWRAACARKYRSFNWHTGLYFGYDGRYHRCRLP